MTDLSVADEYAIWLASTGVEDSVSDDMNEGGDPITSRGDEVSDEDWAAAMKLAHQIATWIRTNPGTVLRLTRESVGSQESTGAAE